MSRDATSYPAERFPVTPVLSAGSLLGKRRPRIPALTDGAQVLAVTSGRVALALAMRALGLAPGERVLVPAYHSMSMIPPLLAAGAVPVFYRIGPDASADLADVDAKRAGARVLIVINYFGFPQDLAAIRAFCDQRGMAMVEDCAHSYFGRRGELAIGSVGDYAIASSMKFFPIYEGGCLVSHRHSLAGIALRSAGAGFELKAALASVERAISFGRLPCSRALLWFPLMLKDRVWRMLKGRRRPGVPGLTPSSSDSSYEFNPRWLDKRSALFSRLVVRCAARARIGDARRANYQALAAALAGLPGMRPLFPRLPDGVYPWVFPLVVDDPDQLFIPLKRAGLPIIRFAESLWPGVDAAVCPVSSDLSRRVLGFPCHQELRPAERAWMIAAIRSAAGAV